MSPDIRVVIVFTEDVSDSLVRFASRGHVWVVRSPANERVVEAYWRNAEQNPDRNPEQSFSVTIFDSIEPTAPASERLHILWMVDEHRWDYSSTHEFPILEVVGLSLDASAADYLRAFGFSRFEQGSDGFSAHRPARPHELD